MMPTPTPTLDAGRRKTTAPGQTALLASGCGTAVASVCALALVQIRQSLDGPWSVAAVLVAGAACGVLARAFARLCHVVPSGVGLPAYLSRAFGRRAGLRLTVPYLVLTVLLAGIEARIVGSLLESLLGLPAWSGAVSFLVVTWGICRLGLRPGYRAQIVATAGLMLVLAGLAAVAVAAAIRDGRLPEIAMAPAPSARAFLAGVGQAFFLFMGFELVTAHVEVVRSPRPIALALRRSVLVLTLFYALVASGYSAMPAGPAASDAGSWLTPQLGMGEALGGPAALLVVTVACVLASFTSFNGALLALSRLVHAFAVQGALPAGLRRMDPKRLVPGPALAVLLAASLAASLLVLAGGLAVTRLVLGTAAAAATIVYASALWARERPPFREAHRSVLAGRLAAGLASALLLLGSAALVDAVASASRLSPATDPRREVTHAR
jgi:amino acid transporter